MLIRRLSALLLAFPILGNAAGNLSYGPPGGKAQQLIELDKTAVRMSAQGQSQWLLYDDKQKTVFIVDDNKRSYSKLTRETAAQLNAQVAAMQRQIEAQLAALPPDQREMMKSMLPAMPQLGGSHQYSVKKAGQSKKIGQWNCQPYTVLDKEQAKDELCVASLKSVGIANADFALLKRMSETLSGLAEQFGAGSMSAVMDKLEGIPVAYGSAGGSPQSVLLRAGREQPKAERMKLPEEYAEQSLFPGMMP